MSATDKLGCEVLQQLQANLDHVSRALHKASEIVVLPSESPDTIRRRRNSLKRWNEIYSMAFERVQAHHREHNCSVD
ncbi:MAG TPA: hypothetical protein VGL89_06835 [Candidatus Koribacter sp.]